MTPYAKYTAPYLQEWRTYRNLTISELAARSDISRGTILKAEKGGQVTRRVLTHLARALNITDSQLMVERPPKSKK